jgi:hypothetical protein
LQQQTIAGFQRFPPQQSAHPRPCRVRDDAPLADDARARGVNGDRPSRGPSILPPTLIVIRSLKPHVPSPVDNQYANYS